MQPALLSVFPIVTVQLPVYNELYVIERLIDAVVQLNYPKAKLHIQVLDDSTDETMASSVARLQLYRQQDLISFTCNAPFVKAIKPAPLPMDLKAPKVNLLQSLMLILCRHLNF